jgi:CHRD domain
MRWTKLTAFTLLVTSFAFNSCSKEEEYLVRHEYVNNAIQMTGAQEVPAVTTAATGTIEANYSQFTKTLTYKVTWSGLSGNATAAHIHGTAKTGFVAGVLQTFVGFPAKTSGTFSGSLLADGVKILEEHILAGEYYINIHTAANTGGEIRGQLNLTKK